MNITVLSLTSGWENRGVETVVGELASRWGREHEVKVYQAGPVGRKQHNYVTRVMDVGFDWMTVKQGDWRRKLMFDEYHTGVKRFTRQVLAELQEKKVDVVMPMNGGWQSWMVKRYCRARGIKMLVSGQAGLGWNDRWNILMRPDVFVALSQRNAKWAKRGALGVRVEVIPNGVDLERFKPEGNKMKLRLKRPVVLCVASGDRYKRVEWVMEAMVNWGKGSLLLAGGSSEQQERGKKLLGERFQRVQVGHDRMPAVFRSADIFTLMSERSEAFGVAYVEALASGLPVVVPDDELRREILGEYGVYVSGREVEDLVVGLEQAVQLQPVRPDEWLARFNWDKIADEYLRVMEIE